MATELPEQGPDALLNTFQGLFGQHLDQELVRTVFEADHTRDFHLVSDVLWELLPQVCSSLLGWRVVHHQPLCSINLVCLSVSGSSAAAAYQHGGSYSSTSRVAVSSPRDQEQQQQNQPIHVAVLRNVDV
jgi:hypothetical protein